MTLRTLIRALCLVMMFPACSCKSDKQELPEPGEALVTVGDSTLMLRDVVARIPSGLPEPDSVAMFHRIVEDWLRGMVLTDFARANVPDIERIERMVADYRNDLIVSAYLHSMTETQTSEVAEERIRQYYEANKDNMVLEEPLIKGAFLKISENDRSAADLRQWMAEFSDKSIDKIEEAGLRRASTYKYFKDQWVAWSDVAQQIPYRFFDADAFVRGTRNFETTDAGSTYLLHISDFILAGEEMPYEYARLKIREILAVRDLAKRKEKLITEIYKQQIKNGNLKPEAYDPLTNQIKIDDKTQ